MDKTLEWGNKKAIDAAFERINMIGNPSNLELDKETDQIVALIWEKNSVNNSALKGTIFERIEVRNTEEQIFYPKFDNNSMDKVFKCHCVSVSIHFDLGSSKYRDDIMFNMKAPIEYFPQKKLLTVYGPSFAACLSTIMVITNCSLPDGCSVDKVNEKSLLLGAYKFSKKDIKTISAQVVANIKSSKSPGNPIPETD